MGVGGSGWPSASSRLFEEQMVRELAGDISAQIRNASVLFSGDMALFRGFRVPLGGKKGAILPSLTSLPQPLTRS